MSRSVRRSWSAEKVTGRDPILLTVGGGVHGRKVAYILVLSWVAMDVVLVVNQTSSGFVDGIISIADDCGGLTRSIGAVSRHGQ